MDVLAVPFERQKFQTMRTALGNVGDDIMYLT